MTAQKPDWFGSSLTPADRKDLLLGAAQGAAVMAAIAAGGWYLTKIVTSTDEPLWHGAFFVVVVFVAAFVWNWRRVLTQAQAMLDHTDKRN